MAVRKINAMPKRFQKATEEKVGETAPVEAPTDKPAE